MMSRPPMSREGVMPGLSCHRFRCYGGPIASIGERCRYGLSRAGVSLFRGSCLIRLGRHLRRRGVLDLTSPFWRPSSVASFILLDPDLARERMRPGGKKPPRAVAVFRRPVPALDRRRARSRPVSLERYGAAVAPDPRPVAVAGSYAFALWAMSVNRFFSSVIRIQSDRGQYVVTTGPYAVIRHPGYTAASSSC